MKSFPIIKTDRLLLRELREEDAMDIYSYFSKDEVTRFYDLYTFTEVQQASDLLQLWINRFYQDEGIRWGIVLKDSQNRLIGTCGYHSWSKEHNRAEIGYELHPDYWGKGLMTEAIDSIVQYGRDALRLRRIEAFIDPINESSGKILEKVGMQSEGVLRDYFFEKGRFVDAEIYAKINQENGMHQSAD